MSSVKAVDALQEATLSTRAAWKKTEFTVFNKQFIDYNSALNK
jgi:hypothetical protein